ncbi:MAG: PKD domain-containing protein [Thermoplasmatales archaeon]|nr:MAG: PKD domain-containing protein [Thermoplasmatales archaeon]
MKKILLLLVVGFLVLNGLEAVALNANNNSQLLVYKTGTASLSDELDQSQAVMTTDAFLPVGQVPVPENPINVQAAQSFIPTKEILTRVELLIGKNSTATHPYVLAIREELNGSDLTLTNTEPAQVPTEEFGWVEIDFDDIMVTTSQTYYIVSYTDNITDNFYGWGANNISTSYPHGCAWISIDDGSTWSNKSTLSSSNSVETRVNLGGQARDDPITWDTCFKTYGRDNSPPETPTIDGPTKGKVGVEHTYCIINATDPDGDELWVFWDWGDGTNSSWLGPYISGEDICASHTWDEKGDYIIQVKLRDEYGAIVTASLEVTMPRNRIFNLTLLFLRFFEQHPQMFPILRCVLGL